GETAEYAKYAEGDRRVACCVLRETRRGLRSTEHGTRNTEHAPTLRRSNAATLPRMKLLRNPIVVGILVVVAIGVVVYQIFQPRLKYARQASRMPAAFVAPMPALSAPPPSQPAPAVKASSRVAGETAPRTNAVSLQADLPIDREFVAAHFERWVNTPRRDPFFLVTDVPVATGPDTNSPVLHWKLEGIWNQT